MTINLKAAAIVSLCVAATATFTTINVSASEVNWADSIKVSGDFRYRMETIDQEESEERSRSRFRARIKLGAEVNDQVKFGMRLATGGENPLSANQSGDKFATTKDFGVERAFVAWTPYEGHTITAGKFSAPLYASKSSQMFWDDDINPEGLAYNYTGKNGFFANLTRLNLDECSSCDDSFLTAAQAGYSYKMASGNKLTVAIAQREFDLNAEEVDIDFNSGRFDLIDAYSETQILADYAMKLNGTPLFLHANYVVNGDGGKVAEAEGLSDDLDSAFEVGFIYGSAKKPGQWELRYNYKEVDAFSVFPLWGDSNFGGGNSATDSQGHQFDIRYAFQDDFIIAFRYFINERFLSSELDADPATRALDYNRAILDFRYKF